MDAIDQITYRARNGSAGVIYEAATSIREIRDRERWQRRLEPMLGIGRPPARAYLNFGTRAAFIGWSTESGSHFDWQAALVLVASPEALTGSYAPELPDLDLPMLYKGGGQAPLARADRGPGHDAIEARACSADAIQVLIPLLAHALRGERRVTIPWTEPLPPEAVLWGVVSILEMIGDPRPVSFHTHVSSSSRDPDTPGRFGPPVVLGFVGLTMSGKSHLLASMVGAIVGRELEKQYGITTSPLDHAWHRRFMETWVNPLLKHDKVLPGTGERRVVEFADAFLMQRRGGPERVVALFDVAGSDLAQLGETKEFLWIANGLFFVVDPDRLSARWAEDETFSNVLDVVRKRVRRGPVSAAIVLNKADMVRFEEPVDRWLRSEGSRPSGGALDSVEFLRESADVYAFLDSRNALAMAEPYEVCDKATLHVASPTGGADTGEGGVYPRGVTPRRVLRPLVAMLAMTGVLTGPEAEMVGV